MLTVIKRSGREEPFDIEKINATLGIASDELRMPLSTGGIRLISEPLLESLEGRERITSREILDSLVASMRKNGFNELADAYANYIKKR